MRTKRKHFRRAKVNKPKSKKNVGRGRKKDRTKINFGPAESMIRAPGTEFKVLTIESLFGFMITMDVDEINSEYIKFRSSEPITKYLLKISIITQDTINLPIFKNIEKCSETMLNLYREAKLQQHLWLDSIRGNKTSICPAAYSISYDCGPTLFSDSRGGIKRRTLNDDDVYDYIHGILYETNRHHFGCILMEYIPNSTPLGSILRNARFLAIRNTAIISAGAQVLRLFLDHSIIHLDLHSGNILIDEHGRAYIIDFGRILELEHMPPQVRVELFLNTHDIRTKRLQYKYDIDHALTRHMSDVDIYETKVIICRNILYDLQKVDSIHHDMMFGGSSAQMTSLYDAILANYLYSNIFDEYLRISRTIEVTGNARLLQSGELELINDDGLNAQIDAQNDAAEHMYLVMTGARFAEPPPPSTRVIMPVFSTSASTVSGSSSSSSSSSSSGSASTIVGSSSRGSSGPTLAMIMSSILPPP